MKSLALILLAALCAVSPAPMPGQATMTQVDAYALAIRAAVGTGSQVPLLVLSDARTDPALSERLAAKLQFGQSRASARPCAQDQVGQCAARVKGDTLVARATVKSAASTASVVVVDIWANPTRVTKAGEGYFEQWQITLNLVGGAWVVTKREQIWGT